MCAIASAAGTAQPAFGGKQVAARAQQRHDAFADLVDRRQPRHARVVSLAVRKPPVTMYS